MVNIIKKIYFLNIAIEIKLNSKYPVDDLPMCMTYLLEPHVLHYFQIMCGLFTEKSNIGCCCQKSDGYKHEKYSFWFQKIIR